MSKIRFFGDGPNEAQAVESAVSSTPGFDQSQTPVAKIWFSLVHCAAVNETW